mmetsp:Transcript_85360/g.267048  ORF Transcript_85360/g.267048 Transcript_85360/m.267048 type:complete len:260 (+) Transcript_85360:1425-2204(+)
MASRSLSRRLRRRRSLRATRWSGSCSAGRSRSSSCSSRRSSSSRASPKPSGLETRPSWLPLRRGAMPSTLCARLRQGQRPRYQAARGRKRLHPLHCRGRRRIALSARPRLRRRRPEATAARRSWRLRPVWRSWSPHWLPRMRASRCLKASRRGPARCCAACGGTWAWMSQRSGNGSAHWRRPRSNCVPGSFAPTKAASPTSARSMRASSRWHSPTTSHCRPSCAQVVLPLPLRCMRGIRPWSGPLQATWRVALPGCGGT